MASKRNKRRQRKKHDNPSSPETRAALARRALETGNFRDAIVHFKALLKIEDSDEWRAGLAAAYQERARELAAKGMFIEALVIWDNRSTQHLVLPDFQPQYRLNHRVAIEDTVRPEAPAGAIRSVA